jgi:uncharacterized protein (TIGR03067 family)
VNAKVLVGFLVATAPLWATQGEDPGKDLDALRGTWKVIELTEKGEKIPAKELEPVEVVMLGTKMTVNDEGKLRDEITMKLNASKKPKTMDLHYTKGKFAGKVERCIYHVEGDTLKICVNEKENGERPAEFASTKENEFAVVVLKKVKD